MNLLINDQYYKDYIEIQIILKNLIDNLNRPNGYKKVLKDGIIHYFYPIFYSEDPEINEFMKGCFEEKNNTLNKILLEYFDNYKRAEIFLDILENDSHQAMKYA